jgi:hypothetical protein
MGAIGDYDSALRLDPKLASALYGQGFAKLKGPDLVGVNVDIAAAKTIKQNIANEFCSLWAVRIVLKRATR